jgi:PAS domain S-box-containing protein
MEPILRSVFESAVDAIVVIDRHGIVRAFNPSVERLFVHHADPVNLVERQSEDLYSLLTGMESYRVLSLDEVEQKTARRWCRLGTERASWPAPLSRS